MLDPTQRFSSRVENYIKYRPGYPQAILDLLRRECRLTPAAVIADMGSGTGILAGLFLANGNQVFAVEPNREMREAGERLLAQNTCFVSVAATAEVSTLQDATIDFVVAGQAFHWFDPEKARAEFARVLKPGGWCVLIWNERRVSDEPFQRSYEHMLKTYSPDYAEVDHRRIDALVLRAFFEPDSYQIARFDNSQRFDFEGLRGRLLSSSYAPEPGHPNYEPMLAALRQIFDANLSHGAVTMAYDTTVYWGHLTR